MGLELHRDTGLGLLRAFNVESYLLLVLMFCSVLLSIVITSTGEEKVGLYASRAFVCLSSGAIFCLLPFSLPLGVGGWLRIVNVALP